MESLEVRVAKVLMELSTKAYTDARDAATACKTFHKDWHKQDWRYCIKNSLVASVEGKEGWSVTDEGHEFIKLHTPKKRPRVKKKPAVATKKVETVVEDIREVLKNVIAGTSHAVEVSALEHLGKRVAEKVANTLTARTKKRPPKTLYASELGKPCKRQLWWSYHHPEVAEPIYPELAVKFLYGDLLEELMLFFAEAAGHEVTGHQELVEHTLDNGWTIRGRIDAQIDGVVVDVKSASGYGFKKFQEGLDDSNDAFGYRTQLAVYTDQPDAGFLVINKENGAMTYSKNEVDFNLYDAVESAISAVESVSAPPIPYAQVPDGKSGNLKLCTECSYCSYKEACYKAEGVTLRKFLYSGKPVYLTKVVREPKVEEAK